MTCVGGACACADASGSFVAVNICSKQAVTKPFYCGASPNPDAPEGCVASGSDFIMGEVWCCP
jgi:hypothetical protein